MSAPPIQSPAGEDRLTVAVVGAGYVGLVTGACLAELGHAVTCVDSDLRRIADLSAGLCPIYEPGLEEMIHRNVAAGRLRFSTPLADLTAVRAVILAVGTPPRADTGAADLSMLFEAVRQLAPALGRHTAVLVKSTAPPGTADAVQRQLERLRPDLQPTVIANPEFLREGAAIADFMRPDRIVGGCASGYGRWVLGRLYGPLTAQGAPLLLTSRRSAELVTYASNAIADLCEALGGDVGEVSEGVGLDSRIGAQFLEAGPGYGGSCFPKDTLALLATAAEYETALRVVAGAAAANRCRAEALAQRVAGALGGSVKGRRIALLGLTFKPDTDDVRESPAVGLAARLRQAGAEVVAFDPRGMAEAIRILPDLALAPDPYACATGAEAVILATHWPEFARLDFARLAELVDGRLFVDLRNAAPLEALLSAGFTVHGVGRPLRAPERGPPSAAVRSSRAASPPSPDAFAAAAP
jgi:UDPglucose 6-dehydrogenase